MNSNFAVNLIFGFDVYSRWNRKRKTNETLLLKAYRRHQLSIKMIKARFNSIKGN